MGPVGPIYAILAAIGGLPAAALGIAGWFWYQPECTLSNNIIGPRVQECRQAEHAGIALSQEGAAAIGAALGLVGGLAAARQAKSNL